MDQEKKMSDKLKSILNIPPSRNDPNGSYTGKPVTENEKPIQDADDL